jgi:hypothetical protein
LGVILAISQKVSKLRDGAIDSLTGALALCDAWIRRIIPVFEESICTFITLVCQRTGAFFAEGCIAWLAGICGCIVVLPIGAVGSSALEDLFDKRVAWMAVCALGRCF